MNHDMNLNHNAFEEIIAKKKKREYRLNDVKRRKVKIGDTITFHDLEDSSKMIVVEVEELLIYTDWYTCYKDFFEEDLSAYYENIEQAVKDTYENWWAKEKEQEFGCLIIKFKFLNAIKE